MNTREISIFVISCVISCVLGFFTHLAMRSYEHEKACEAHKVQLYEARQAKLRNLLDSCLSTQGAGFICVWRVNQWSQVFSNLDESILKSEGCKP